MDSTLLFESIEKHKRKIYLFMIPILIILVIGVYVLVFITGGIKYVYSHSMYIPILLSGFVFGVKGGVLIGLIGGIVLGPTMPIDVTTGEPQKTVNWIYRTGFFSLIGFLSGAASYAVIKYLQHIKWISLHCASSKLPNRRALLERLSKIPVGRGTGNTSTLDAYIVALIYIENEVELLSTLGFDVIDKAIPQLARRLENPALPSAYIYRIDTAKIGIVANIHDFHNNNNEDFFEELATIFRKPILFHEIPVHLDTRVGYVMITEFEESPETYLQRAEIALTFACQKSQDYVAYSSAIDISSKENLTILGELQNALESEHLALNYQPKVEISTGAVKGVEALMRWNHPELGNIPPSAFIPRAESSTLINQITRFALEQAMTQMALWQKSGINISTAVNISTRNLLQPDFAHQVLHLLEKHDLLGEQLELEVTEGALMMDVYHTIEELTRLADGKVIISLDDFGVGYSSLQYLHKLPISFIKIDKSFVKKLPYDRSAISIVEAAISLAHKMELKAIAEGIENKEAYEFLANIGCDMAQGFHISRPLPAQDYTKWHTQNNGHFG